MKKFSDLSLAQKILEGLSLALLAGMFLGPLIFWSQIPSQIPGHYNAAGEITRWGGKGELFLLPIVSVFMYCFWTFWVAVLHHNSVVKGELPASACYWLTGVKLSVLADFAVIEWSSAAARLLGAWFAPVSIAVPGVLVAGFLISTIRFAIGRSRAPNTPHDSSL